MHPYLHQSWNTDFFFDNLGYEHSALYTINTVIFIPIPQEITLCVYIYIYMYTHKISARKKYFDTIIVSKLMLDLTGWQVNMTSGLPVHGMKHIKKHLFNEVSLSRWIISFLLWYNINSPSLYV